MIKKKSKKRKVSGRYIRKSLGALCLATAIAVAAIPVPENFATETEEGEGSGEDNGGEGTTSGSDTNDSTIDYSYSVNDEGTVVCIPADEYISGKDFGAKLKREGKEIFKGSYTYKKRVDGIESWHVEEIFDYYNTTIDNNQGSIVCGHKPMRGKEEIRIGDALYANYVKISNDEYGKFLEAVITNTEGKWNIILKKINGAVQYGATIKGWKYHVDEKKIEKDNDKGVSEYDIVEQIFPDELKAFEDDTQSPDGELKVTIETDSQKKKLFCVLTWLVQKDKYIDSNSNLKGCTLSSVIDDDPKNDSDNNTGSETGSSTGSETGSSTGSETGSSTGNETGSSTGSNTGNETGNDSSGSSSSSEDDEDDEDDEIPNGISTCFIPRVDNHPVGRICPPGEEENEWDKLHPSWQRLRHDSNGFICLDRSNSVVGIANYTFNDVFYDVQKIYLTGSLTHIGKEAFKNASMVQELVAPSVKYIGDGAFENCASLSKISWTNDEENQGTPNIIEIGANAFRNSGITKLEIPGTLQRICTGAFSVCSKLTNIYLQEGNRGTPLSIESYAFYDDKNIENVSWSSDGGESVDFLGEGCFAVSYGTPDDMMKTFTFPKGSRREPTDKSTFIKDHILAGRGGTLSMVIMPTGTWGNANPGILPKHTFEGCFELDVVDFKPEGSGLYTGGGIEYEKNKMSQVYDMFKDTVKDTFYVHGPELYRGGSGITDIASPRRCTWSCTNGVRRSIPYKYEKIVDGKTQTYYEICKTQPNKIDKYVLSVLENNGVGELVSCWRLSDTSTTGDIDLEIPKNVGEITLTSLGTDLFKQDPDLKANLRSVSFEEGSQIKEIKSGVFADCPKLEEIKLCSSIDTIGDKAFSNLGKETKDGVVDVYFTSDKIDMPDNAFSTDDEVGMIFHGVSRDLENYRPFQVAMQVPINDKGLYICYKTNSPSSLTIMMDRKNEMPTLVDYPHLEELDEKHYDGELDYNKLENTDAKDNDHDGYIDYGCEAWDTLYANRNSLSYIAKRTLETVTDWKTKYGPGCPNEITLPVGYTEDPDNQGPWNYGTPNKYLFSIVKADEVRSDAELEFLTPLYNLDQTGETIIDNVKNIRIPAGVKSIDSNSFYSLEPVDGKNNSSNILKYLTIEKNKYTKLDPSDPAIIPGLFSGYFKEGVPEESIIRGNDVIRSVDLGTVEFLPDYCFESCENLEKVIMPNCKDVGVLPFKNCPKMSSIDTTGNDDYVFSSQSGILYELNPDKETYTIIECLQDLGTAGTKSITTETDPLLAKTSAIEPYAFENCDKINNVDFTGVDKLTDIPVACFMDCDALGQVILPTNVGSMASKAFWGCDALEDVYIKSREMDPADDAFERNRKDPTAPDFYLPTIHSYANYAPMKYATRLGFSFDYIKEGAWLVKFVTPDGNIIDPPGIITVDDGYKVKGIVPDTDQVPEIDGMEFYGWNPKPNIEIYDNMTFHALYRPIVDPDPTDDKVTVLFLDWDGRRLAPEQRVTIGGNAVPPANPTRSGYTFTGWSEAFYGVVKNTACVAQYKKDGGDDPTPSGKVTVTFVDWDGSTIDKQTIDSGASATKPKDPKRSGYTFDGWKPSYKNVTSNTVCVAQYKKDGDDDDDDDSNKEEKRYLVTVIDGLGSGRYVEGSTVTVTANPAPNGMSFDYWETQSPSAAIQNTRNQVSTFKMPDNDVTVRAVYKRDGTNESNLDSNGNTISRKSGTSDSSDADDGVPGAEQTNCRVEITKGGIPAINKATAKVNGSNDNFVLKISETGDAEALVRAALEGEYGSPLDTGRILYEAFDITLYDSTGEVPITDYTGLSVDITLPLPMKTAQYGGNNHAALCENAMLEDLGVTFKDLGGTPAICFTATHFSPYTIYVDLQNLNHDLDVKGAYKTGDPIHPKWFLSIGLACLSGVLFLKKDKKSRIA